MPPYTPTTWVDDETLANAARLNNMEQGIVDAHAAIGGGGATLEGVVQLDSFTGATDDDKFTNALSYAAAQTRIPAIQFGARQTVLSSTRTPFSGMKLIGPFGAAGPKNLHLSSGKYVNHEVRLNVGSGSSSWMVGPASNLYDVYIGDIAFRGYAGGGSQFWSQTAGTMYSCRFHSLTHYGFKGVFGSRTEKCLNTQINLSGFWVNQSASDTQFHFGGSDSQFWYEGFINYDVNAHAFGSTVVPMVRLDSQSKTNIGYMYLTGVEYWLPLRATGSSNNFTLFGGTMEGFKSYDQVFGSLVHVEAGIATFYGTYFAQAMEAPPTGHDAVVDVSGGNVCLDRCMWNRGGTSATAPFGHVSGGTLIARDNVSTTGDALVYTSSGTGVLIERV